MNFCFLRKTKGILITVDELREELWFATIVVVYGFVKRLLDSKVHQDDVLREEQLLAYIRNKFMTFVSKYELTITKANNRICILLYAIMIFEDFNRGPLIRKVERLILPVKRKATLGVMQVTSGRNITDEESVLKAYDILCDMLDGKDARELNIHDVYLMAEKYNPDENYAKSIVYIYDKLYDIILEDEALAKQFLFYNEIDDDLGIMGDYADKPVMQEQEFEAFGALLEKLKDNVYFNLKTTEGNILQGVQESQHVCIEGEKSGWTLVLHDLSNVTIDGNNSTLYSVFGKFN